MVLNSLIYSNRTVATVWQLIGCVKMDPAVSGFPGPHRTGLDISHPPARVWSALTTAEGLGTWSTTSTPSDPHAADVEAIAVQVFVALADPTRRGILAELAARGPATATDLAGRVPVTRQAIAKHLAPLGSGRERRVGAGA
jgi:hypothetical protein